MKKLIAFAVVFFVSSLLHAQQARQIISYQGMIQDANGVPVRDSIYPIAVSFWTDATGGTRLWRDVFPTTVTGGVFNIQLGSANPLPSPKDMDRPLWISVSFNGDEEALPRSPLSSVPTALNVADSSITAKKLNLDYISSININGVQFTGHGTPLNIQGENGITAAYKADSNTLVLYGPNNSQDAPIHNGSSDYWGETGNYLVDPATGHFLGTTGDTAFEIHVDNSGPDTEGRRSVMRFEPNIGSANIIAGWNAGGATGNRETSGSYGIVISGGGYDGSPNVAVNTTYGSIGGGHGNSIDTSVGGTIAGGEGGTVRSNDATIGGGLNNTAGIHGDDNQRHQTVGGGSGNTASGDDAVIAGGEYNTATAYHTAVAGGLSNNATATGAAVGGGENNTASGDHAAVMGGLHNTASDSLSAILGGQYLKLGKFSVGFNTNTHLTDLSADTNIAYLGDVDLWLGNIDNTARALRFYSPNTSTTYSSSAHYSSFQATSQPQGNILYTLPDSLPLAGEFLQAKTVTGTSVTLKWETTSGGGGGLAGWLLAGNSGTTAGPNYLGTQDSQAFEIHVHNNALDTSGGNQRVVQYSEGSTSPNILGGSSANILGGGLSGAAILSGGSIVEPNRIDTLANFFLIGAGSGNRIQGGPPFNVWGGDTGVTSTFGTITGGEKNTITKVSVFPNGHSVIGGGQGNVVESEFDVISGGRGNQMMVDTFRSGFNFIGGGDSNFVGYGSYGNVIAGGKNNLNANGYGSIGGGLGNLLNGSGGLNVIGGGYYNTVGGDISVNANITRSTIGGGDSNIIRQYASYSTIGGGSHNLVDSAIYYSFIGGGSGNRIGPATIYDSIFKRFIPDTIGYSVIAGGNSNSIRTWNSTIGGGVGNLIDTNNCGCSLAHVIAGGIDDTISGLDARWYDTLPWWYESPRSVTIGGGQGNTANGNWATVGGGTNNHAVGQYATIPGGQNLLALDYQTVIGHYNLNVTPKSQLLTNWTADAITFMLGNGKSDTARSNAIEASDNGHLIVHDSLGNTPKTPTGGPRNDPIVGGTYKDNVINAWGDVPGDSDAALPAESYWAPNTFGLAFAAHVTRTGLGTYSIAIQCFNSDGLPRTLTAAAIQVTVEENGSEGCGYATCSRIAGNMFTVHTYFGAPSAGMCQPQNRDFFFTLVGR